MLLYILVEDRFSAMCLPSDLLDAQCGACEILFRDRFPKNSKGDCVRPITDSKGIRGIWIELSQQIFDLFVLFCY